MVFFVGSFNSLIYRDHSQNKWEQIVVKIIDGTKKIDF